MALAPSFAKAPPQKSQHPCRPPANTGLLTPPCRLLSASCTSDQRFACGFLQTPPRDGHPCRPA